MLFFKHPYDCTNHSNWFDMPEVPWHIHKKSENLTCFACDPATLRMMNRIILRDDSKNKFLQIYCSISVVVEDAALLELLFAFKNFTKCSQY